MQKYINREKRDYYVFIATSVVSAMVRSQFPWRIQVQTPPNSLFALRAVRVRHTWDSAMHLCTAMLRGAMRVRHELEGPGITQARS